MIYPGYDMARARHTLDLKFGPERVLEVVAGGERPQKQSGRQYGSMAICYPVTAFVQEDGRQATVLVNHPTDDLLENLLKAASIPPGTRRKGRGHEGKGSSIVASVD